MTANIKSISPYRGGWVGRLPSQALLARIVSSDQAGRSPARQRTYVISLHIGAPTGPPPRGLARSSSMETNRQGATSEICRNPAPSSEDPRTVITVNVGCREPRLVTTISPTRHLIAEAHPTHQLKESRNHRHRADHSTPTYQEGEHTVMKERNMSTRKRCPRSF